MPLNKIIFIVGPTAVGKSEVAFELARKLHSDVLSCDSMQIYKGMDIITSKPNSSLMKRVKHHFIGVIPCGKEYNVSKYRKEAVKIINRLVREERIPVFCGGTGLYVSMLVDGIFKGNKVDLTLRRKLYKLADKYGKNYLYNRLKAVDKAAAGKIHPNDTRRIVRALEVFQTSGKPISVLQKERSGLSRDYDVKIFCLNMNRASLYKRIDTRVDKMLKSGLLDEVKRLLGKELSKTAKVAIGLRELEGYLEGRYSLEEAARLMKRNSRHYAKRQLTWFRNNKRVNWINIKDKDKPKQVAQRIFKTL